MHSAVQTELRLTQKAIRASCRHCTHRCYSPKRNFHQGRGLRASQGARNDAASVPGAPPADEKNDAQKNLNAAAEQQGIQHSTSFPNPSTSSIKPNIPSDDSDPAAVGDYYGSLSKRRLRTRNVREPAEVVQSAPDWFIENNVQFWGQCQSPNSSAPILVRSTNDTSDDLVEPIGLPSSETPKDEPPTVVIQPEGNAKSKDQPDDAGSAKDDKREAKLGQRYYVVEHQWEELLRTTKAMIRAPEGRRVGNHFETAVTISSILIHYAARDGDIFLDHTVRQLAHLCGSDIISIDAQDIAELIGTSQERETATEGRMLSYGVFNDVYGEPSTSVVEGNKFGAAEEAEDDFDDFEPFENSSAQGSRGIPVMIGKPIKIDLAEFFGSKDQDSKTDRRGHPRSVLSDMLFRKPRPPTPPFASLVEGMLSAVPDSQKRVPQADSAQDKSLKRPIIVHVKNHKAIQDFSVGRDFLAEVYDQVQKRRNAGECIVILGTDSKRQDLIDRQHIIDEPQRSMSDKLSHLIVLTPLLPNMTSRLALLHDRRQRIASINMRHLWETMRYKTNNDFLGFKTGFWKEDFRDRLMAGCVQTLERHIWNFNQVHRIAAFIQGTDPAQPFHGLSAVAESVPGKAFPIISMAANQLAASDGTRVRWAEKQASKHDVVSPPRSKEDERFAKIRASASKYEKRLMSGVIEPDKISTTFNDIHLPVELIDGLQTLTTLSLVRPEAFQYGVLASDKIPGLLLYGPPGTGKTLLAKAVAKESGATVLEVSAADINDMYVGEGEKNVKALFSLARKLSPCIVFLDEADAMFSSRTTEGRRASHRELLNQFLKEWDGMSNDSGSAFIMVATNRPMDLDDAVLRRLPRRLLVDLPSELDRLEILKIHLRQEDLAPDVDLAAIAKKTPFYSGSDLKNTAVAAALNAVREENEAAKEYQGDGEYKYPDKRTLTAAHFEKALSEISASISEDMASLRDIRKFDEQYGDKRGKKRRAPRWGFRTAAEATEVLDTVKVRS